MRGEIYERLGRLFRQYVRQGRPRESILMMLYSSGADELTFPWNIPFGHSHVLAWEIRAFMRESSP